jgi:hypothetical protein
MAPPRVRRANRASASAPQLEEPPADIHENNGDAGDDDGETIFVDLIMGTPLAMFVEKDVPDRDNIADLIAVRRLVRDDAGRVVLIIADGSETWRHRCPGVQRRRLHPRCIPFFV